MAYTNEQLTELRARYASGAQSCMLNGEMVTFRTVAEFKRIEADIVRYLESSASGGPSLRRVHQPITSSGWRD